MAGLFPEIDEDAIFLNREDVHELLGTYSHHPFILEDQEWPSVEHYFQAMKFENLQWQDKIRRAPHPKKARKAGRSRRKSIRSDWSKVKNVYMTRGLYSKCIAHAEVKVALLETGKKKLMENSQFDYYWGCGRDRRGENNYGKVLMNIRQKIITDQSNSG